MSRKEENPHNRLFVSRLSKAMKHKSLTINDMAFLVNIDQGIMSDYITGQKSPDSSELGRLSQVLGVSMGWLWGLENSIHDSNTSNTSEVIELQAKLSMAVDTLRGALFSLEKKVVRRKTVCNIIR